jgi:hypothetical protein
VAADPAGVNDGRRLDRERMLVVLADLDRTLDARDLPHQELITVGGSYLAMVRLRAATMDVDVVTRLTEATRAAIGEVAGRHGLGPRWLNDSAAVFRPAGLTVASCTPVFEGSALRVLTPSADWVFLMKMYAGRLVDRPDLVKLWPHTGFATAAEAVERYWDAYPHAPDDAHLDGFVENIIRQVP